MDQPEVPGVSCAAAVSASPIAVVGFSLIGVLAGLGVLLAYRSGSYLPRLWLPVLVAVAAFALVALVAGPRVIWKRGQTVLLGAFAALSLWTLMSTIWAGSLDNAWEESNRTFLYLLGFLLSATAVAWSGRAGMRLLVWAVLGGVLVVAAGAVMRLYAAQDLAAYFSDGRLHYPVTYWNGLAALYMIGFWLAMGLSTERAVRASQAWTRPLLVGLAVTLAELALLPQSRGAFYAFFLVSPFFVALSNHRFRALLNLAVVAGVVAIAWDRLVVVMPAVAAGEGASELDSALAAVALTAVGATVACGLTWLLELRMGTLSPSTVRMTGAVLGVAAVAVVALGILFGGVGNLADRAQSAWTEITSDAAPSPSASSRFTQLGLTGRLQQWQVAGEAFLDNPVLGLGAQNFESFFNQHRQTGLSVRQPHSQPMQLLAELGLLGFILWTVVVLGTLGRATATRMWPPRADHRDDRTLLATMIVAVLAWLVHSSADWLWQLAGVTWPSVLLLGGMSAYGAQLDQSPAASTVAEGRSHAPKVGPGYRWMAVALTVLAMTSASLQLVFLRYVDVAASTSTTAPSTAIAATRAAQHLNPFSPLPAAQRAVVYAAATDAGEAHAGASGFAVLDNLALAYVAWEEAVTKEPGNWLLSYRAGSALLDYRDTAATVAPPGRSPQSSAEPGLLGASAAEKAAADRLRTLDAEQLGAMARTLLEEAKRLNPLSPQVNKALGRLRP